MAKNKDLYEKFTAGKEENEKLKTENGKMIDLVKELYKENSSIKTEKDKF